MYIYMYVFPAGKKQLSTLHYKFIRAKSILSRSMFAIIPVTVSQLTDTVTTGSIATHYIEPPHVRLKQV